MTDTEKPIGQYYQELIAEHGKLKTELESLRQENSRLRQENHRLKAHLCIGTDALKEPTDMYEVVRKDELHRLRESLQYIIAWGPDPHIAKTAREALNPTKERA